MNCKWVMWFSSAMSKNIGDTWNSNTAVGGGGVGVGGGLGRQILLALLQNFFIAASILLISCLVLAVSCSFETSPFNTLMQVSLGPSPSVHFEINMIHFSESGSVFLASSRAVCIRMSRRPSIVRSWFYEFLNSKKSSASCVWISKRGLMHWVWRKRQERLSVGRLV